METRRGARGLSHQGRSSRAPQVLVDGGDSMANSIICTDNPGNILSTLTSTDEQHPFELAREATENCERMWQQFDQVEERTQRIRSQYQLIDSLLAEIRSDCAKFEKPKEMLLQCTGILETGAFCLQQQNTKQQKEASAQAEEAEQQDWMEVSQEQESSSWCLEQLSQESSGQGHEVAQAWREEELLAQKADLEGRLAATEWLRQDLARQLEETRSAKESLQSRLFAAQLQMAQLQMTWKRVEAELQGELQGARREAQAAQRRHKEELQGLKEEMHLLLEQREALQKQVAELTSQLAASRECQERTAQRAQQEGMEAQEESRQKLLEIEQIQKMLEEAEHQNKELQMHLDYLERGWIQCEEMAEQNSDLQASVNALEREKARLILSLEEKNVCLRMLEEQNLALNNQVSQCQSALQQAKQLSSNRAGQLRELNTQIRALQDAVLQMEASQATQQKQLLKELEESRAGERSLRDSVHVLQAEVSELRVRLQSSDDKALALAIQCEAVELELRKAQAQRDNLRARNLELQKEWEEIEQDCMQAEAKHICHQIALEKEATERQEEAVALRQEPGEGAVTRNPPGGDSIESGETGGPGASHPSSSPKPPEPSEPPGDPLTPSGDPPGPRPPPEPPGVPADPSPNPSPPLADSAQEAEGLARSFWEGLAAEARNIERASARASGGGDPPPYPFEYGAGGRGEGWSPPARGGKNPEPRPAANTHARETSAEPMPGREPGVPADAHAWGCDRGQALTREPRPLLPPYMGEIPPCGRQGEPRGRHRQQHQHRPRGEERGRSRTKRQQRPEVYWQSTSDSEGSHSSPDRSVEPTESSSDSEAEKTESMRFRTKPIKNFNTTGNQPQYELTDWGKIKIECAEWAPAASVHAFPGARGLSHQGRSSRAPQVLVDGGDSMANSIICTDNPGNILSTLTSTDEQHPFELAREATENCERMWQQFDQVEERTQRIRSQYQLIDSLLAEIRSDCAKFEKPKEMLLQCTGILETGAFCLQQQNTKQQKEASAQAEEAEQQDWMEVSQEQESSSWCLEQLSQESSGQGHEVAQVWREEELLAQKADLEGRLAATEWLRQDLARQLEETRSAKESLQSRLFAAQQQMAQLQMTWKRVEAELQGELQGARREAQAAQRRHKEELQGLKEEMHLLLEQREALQKQVAELTSQLAASRECQERTAQRAQQEGREAQEESRQKLLEIEQIQKMLEEAEHQNKELQMHLDYLERGWIQCEEMAEQNSDLQASVNALEKEKARLILSLEEKDVCLRMLEEQNLALNHQVSQCQSALQQAKQISSNRAGQLRELNTQIRALQDAVLQMEASQATQQKQLLKELEESRAGERSLRDSVHVLQAEVSELRVRLQSSDDKALALAIQCEAVELELRKTQTQRDNLRARNLELQKEWEEIEQDCVEAEAKHICLQIALEKEATERQEEAVALRQEVASLRRKLEKLEKERKDVLVALLQSQLAQERQHHLESCAGSRQETQGAEGTSLLPERLREEPGSSWMHS
ncbi:centrosome-associated protein CEP250-like [Agelaius tricolor]|uniref:centrosome-associated protein CEP250-like n=1 Tax=Agelaius tricolor TaxID=9191 RepID=UPI0039F1C7EF